MSFSLNQPTGGPGSNVNQTATTLNISSGNTNTNPVSNPLQPSGSLFPNVPSVSTVVSTSTSFTVPYYGEKYDGEQTWFDIKKLAEVSFEKSDDGKRAGEELLQILQLRNTGALGNHLVSPVTLPLCPPDMEIRRRLSENPLVMITTADKQEQEANITKSIFDEICSLSDNLRISEIDAISLYHFTSSHPTLMNKFSNTVYATTPFNESNENNLQFQSIDRRVGILARYYYFYERSMHLHTTLMLLQFRQNSRYAREVTDIFLQGGLIMNLVRIIKEYTMLIDKMDRSFRNSTPSLSEQHIDFFIQQRQTATECLFFSAYDVQLRSDEIVSILVLIRDLSNGPSNDEVSGKGLPQLDPFTDVPDNYELTYESTTGSSNSPWHQPKTEVGPLKWHRLVVESVQRTKYPHLLRCVSSLIITFIVSLDTQNVLINRDSHDSNSFGKGNALFPPGSSDMSGLGEITGLLTADALNSWKRSDVLGLLMMGFAMLLHQPNSSVNGSSGASLLKDCIKLAVELKAFTFARFSLIPGLQKPAFSPGYCPLPSCDVRSFMLASFAEFISRSIDVVTTSEECPPSRASWLERTEYTLHIQRSYEEQQRKVQGHFFASPNASIPDTSTSPSSIDFSKRPDCLDDIFALACSICTLHPDYALRFWTQQTRIEYDGEDERYLTMLTPSAAFSELQSQQMNDQSLRPCYISFLAALALAKNDEYCVNGAAVVHDMLSSTQAGDALTFYDSWATLLDTLRYYVKELNPAFYAAHRITGTDPPNSSIPNSTEYYYLDEASSNKYGDEEISKEIYSATKTKELGLENTEILLSHLSVIANVALNDPNSRSFIAQTKLLMRSSDLQDAMSQDVGLNVLFSLAIMPLEPEVRGVVFRTIAAVLSIDGITNIDQLAEFRALSRQGWDLLESCNIVPVIMLQQYQSGPTSVERDTGGLSFPPSSLLLAAEKVEKSWIESDPRYSIVYEMEYIESSMGYYPSTEGLLFLLKSLVMGGGCPSSLGTDWRLRKGTTPYIEYVLHFVMPRACGRFMRLPALPFRSRNDYNRLVALGLEVLLCTLSRYCLPINIRSPEASVPDLYQSYLSHAKKLFGLDELVTLTVSCPLEEDLSQFIEDFGFSTGQTSDSMHSQPIFQHEKQSASSSLLPGTKSPYFTILSDILSQSGGYLLDIIVEILNENRNRNSIQEADAMSLSYALYGATVPTYYSTADGVRHRSRSRHYTTLIRPLFPSSMDFVSSDACIWESRAMLGALGLLCSAVLREDAWIDNLKSSKTQMTLVPFLRFQSRSVPIALGVKATKVAFLLSSSERKNDVLSALDECIKVSSNEYLDVEIAASGTALLFCLDRCLHPKQLQNFLTQNTFKTNHLVHTFGERVNWIEKSGLSKRNTEFLNYILSHMVATLRCSTLSNQTLTTVLLGVHVIDLSFGKSNLVPSSPYSLNGILQILESNELSASDELTSILSSGYELLYLLTRTEDDALHMIVASSVSKMLRDVSFLKTHLLKMTSLLPRFAKSFNVLFFHGIAWLIKSASSELQSLRQDSSTTVSTIQAVDMLSILFCSGGFMETMLQSLRVEKYHIDGLPFTLSENDIRKTKITIEGSPEIVEGFELVFGEELAQMLDHDGAFPYKNDVITWANQWNSNTMADCSSAHVAASVCQLICAASETCRNYLDTKDSSWSDNQILVTILELMCTDAIRSSSNFDETLLPATSRNLALAALMATQTHVSRSRNKDNITISTRACHLLAQAMKYSCGRNEGTYLVNDRTCSLACALSILLEELPETEQIYQYRDDFLEAACVLVAVSAHSPSTGFDSSQAKFKVVARTALILILDIFGKESDSNSAQFCRFVFTQPTIDGSTSLESLLSGASLLDVETIRLVCKIASMRHGPILLHECGLLHCLKRACTKHFREGVTANGQSNASPFEQVKLATPSFLLGHLTLLNIMMVSDLTNDLCVEVSLDSLSYLASHRNSIDNILSHFPMDWDILHAASKCVSLAKLNLKHTDVEWLNRNHKLKHMKDETDVFVSYFGRKIIMLALDIAEHPLPPGFLPDVPIRFKKSYEVRISSLVPMLGNSKVWWDYFELSKANAKNSLAREITLSDEICVLACQGLDFVQAGLRLAQLEVSTVDLNPFSICKALYGAMNGLRFIASHSNDISQVSADLSEVKSKLTDCVIKLLVIVYEFIRDNNGIAAGQLRIFFCKEISMVLEYSGFEKIGDSKYHWKGLDEYKLKMITQLSTLVRTVCYQEINQIHM